MLWSPKIRETNSRAFRQNRTEGVALFCLLSSETNSDKFMIEYASRNTCTWNIFPQTFCICISKQFDTDTNAFSYSICIRSSKWTFRSYTFSFLPFGIAIAPVLFSVTWIAFHHLKPSLLHSWLKLDLNKCVIDKQNSGLLCKSKNSFPLEDSL